MKIWIALALAALLLVLATASAGRVGKRGTRRVAMRAAVPVAAIVSVDPQIEITGLEGYPNGLAIDTALITEMFAVQCANGSDVKFVDTRDRAAIEREIKLQRGNGFDPKTRVKPNFTKPDTFISGHPGSSDSAPGYGSITEFLRTNPGFERRQPGADGSIAGSASASKDGKALSWTWAFSPR